LKNGFLTLQKDLRSSLARCPILSLNRRYFHQLEWPATLGQYS
jgi:hypothetical protein